MHISTFYIHDVFRLCTYEKNSCTTHGTFSFETYIKDEKLASINIECPNVNVYMWVSTHLAQNFSAIEIRMQPYVHHYENITAHARNTRSWFNCTVYHSSTDQLDHTCFFITLSRFLPWSWAFYKTFFSLVDHGNRLHSFTTCTHYATLLFTYGFCVSINISINVYF